MEMKRVLPVAALLASLATLAPAADLDMKSGNGIRYVSGGVGQADQQAMDEAARDYSLNLVFAAGEGRYLAGVQTRILKRGGGEVLATVSDGPMLLVDLPAGVYTIEATAEGRTLTREVGITRGASRKVVLRWPGGAGLYPGGGEARP